MSIRKKIQRALDALGMVAGLSGPEVCRRLKLANRTTEVGWRTTAFYLLELVENDHFKTAGYVSFAAYAEAELGLSERRAFELLRIGKHLAELRRLDTAFCRHELAWSKVVELCRIATPQTEAAWIAHAKKNTVKQLRLDIAGRKAGDGPQEARRGLQTEQVRLRSIFRASPEGRALLEAAQRKVAAERGAPATVDETIETALALLLRHERDGETEGWRRVDASLYCIHLYPASWEEDAPLLVRLDDGLVPLAGCEADGVIAAQREACACCDGAHVGHEGHEEHGRHGGHGGHGGHGRHGKIDVPTPPHKRKRALTRDAFRCRCCGRGGVLHVHHIVWRSHGGPTRLWNLICVCPLCRVRHKAHYADFRIMPRRPTRNCASVRLGTTCVEGTNLNAA